MSWMSTDLVFGNIRIRIYREDCQRLSYGPPNYVNAPPGGHSSDEPPANSGNKVSFFRQKESVESVK